MAEVGVADEVVARKMMTLMLRCKLPWVCVVAFDYCALYINPELESCIDATGQNSNAGMLPPSDSDEDSEDETVPVKAKQVTVNQVNRNSSTHLTVLRSSCCGVLHDACNAAGYCWYAAS